MAARAVTIFLAATLAAAAQSPSGGTAAPSTGGQRSSPFLPPAGATAAPVAQASGGAHEFTGVIVSGKTTLINLTDTQAKRSFWIEVGKASDGFEMLSYDPKAESISVRHAGEVKRLTLKQPSVAAVSGGAIATLPVAPTVPVAPLPPPSSAAEAEREARMLVSDLLEIGMQQRKAYEEAQRKAAEEARKNAK